MHHDETGSRAIGERLVDPLSTVPKPPRFQGDAHKPAMSLEGTLVGGTPRQPNLTHHRVQEVVPVGRLAGNTGVNGEQLLLLLRQRLFNRSFRLGKFL
jgi:hypothetical protein